MPLLMHQASSDRRDRFGGFEVHSSLHASQAGILSSQPSVPVIALTDDGAVCALAKLIASQEMLWSLLFQRARLRIRSKAHSAG